MCFEMKWSSLNEHLPALEFLYEMLKMFYSITDFLQADKCDTLSTVYPALKDILDRIAIRFFYFPNIIYY